MASSLENSEAPHAYEPATPLLAEDVDWIS